MVCVCVQCVETGHALKPDKSLHLPAVFAVLSPHTHIYIYTLTAQLAAVHLPLSLSLSHDRWVCKAFPPGWWALFRELSCCKWSHEYEPNGAGFVLQERYKTGAWKGCTTDPGTVSVPFGHSWELNDRVLSFLFMAWSIPAIVRSTDCLFHFHAKPAMPVGGQRDKALLVAKGKAHLVNGVYVCVRVCQYLCNSLVCLWAVFESWSHRGSTGGNNQSLTARAGERSRPLVMDLSE